MHERTAAVALLQPVFSEKSSLRALTSRIPRRRRITRPFTPLPVGYLAQLPLLLQPLFNILWEMNRGQAVEVCFDKLAFMLGRSYRTAQEHAYALERLGVIAVRRRKVSPCRNAPNVFRFPELEGFIELENHAGNCVPDHERATETTTPSRSVERTAEKLPVKPEPKPTYTRQAWEHRRRENHPPQHRQLCEQRLRWLQIAEHKARERCRRSMQASIGTWIRPADYVPPTPEQEAEWKAMAERERQKDKEARAAAERPKLCAECGGTGWNRRLMNRCRCS